MVVAWGWEYRDKAGAETMGEGIGPGVSSRDQGSGDLGVGELHPSLPFCLPLVLQAGPGSISRCGPRIALAAASLKAMAFAMCPAVQVPTSWTAPLGGHWAAGRSSWRGPLWVVGLSCCMVTPSTVGPIAIGCTRLLVAPCTLNWACCCATLIATVWSADPASHHWTPPTSLDTHEGQDGTEISTMGSRDSDLTPV